MSNKEIAPTATPDPWMVAANGVFYFLCTLGNRIELRESPSMEDFSNPRKAVLYQRKGDSPWSTDVWAPELHSINGVWHIYAAASSPGVGNKGHRTIVLRSTNKDPMEKPWEFLGPVKGMPDQFSIDATVFTLNHGQDLYICWSGWPPNTTSDPTQHLYLAKMVSPEEIIPESTVCISSPDLPWERFNGGKKGINEGPTWLDLPNGAFTGIVYSAHASFASEYKLGLLRLTPNANPLDPKSWVKRPTPLLMNDKSNPGPYAPGHASFLPSPDPSDNRVFCIYHGTDNWGDGFKNRKARVIALDPEVFDHKAKPVCSSSAPHNPVWTGGLAGLAGGGVQQALGKKANDIAGTAPSPVHKAFDKVKKFL